MECAYIDCNNKALYFDYMGDPVCEDCFNRETQEYGEDPEEFEQIEDCKK